MSRVSRLLPGLAAVVLAGPILAGLAATLLPAFGYFPALGGDSFGTGFFVALARVPGIGRSIVLSIASGLLTAFASLMIVTGFFAAYAGTPRLSRLQQLASPLLSIPHAAVAFGLAFLVAPSGLLMRLISPDLTGFLQPPDWATIHDPFGLAMMIALVAKEVPFLFLMALSGLPHLPVRRARMDMTSYGYGRIAGFLFSLGPSFYQQLRLPVLAVIAYAASVVDVALVLGPSLPAPLGVRVTQWAGDPDLGLRFLAAAGAVLQLAVIAVCFLIWIMLERVASRLLHLLGERGWRFQKDRFLQIMSFLCIAGSTCIIVGAMGAFALWSVSGLWPFPHLLPETMTWATWQRGLPYILMPLTNSLIIAALSAGSGLALGIGFLWHYTLSGNRPGAMIKAILFLPLLIPQISFVLGLQMLSLMLRLEPSLLLLTMVHLVFVLPYVILSLSAPWFALDPRFEWVARSMGRSSFSTLISVRLPMLVRPCLTALAIGFSVSISLYLPTILIGAGRVTTMTTEAVALSAGGDRRVIGVYSLMQSLLPLLGFVIASLIPQLLFRHRRAMRT